MENKNLTFEKSETWVGYDKLGVAEKKRVPVIMNSIPKNVSSIADVGCGNGLITNRLNGHYDVTGIDISEEALKTVKSKKVCSSATNINLPDNSFDLVLTSEMLEHLNDEDLKKAAGELKRLSKKYILITVPYNENLDQSTVKCPNCGHGFHIVGHQQSFNKSSLTSHFQGEYDVNKIFTFGDKVVKYNSFLLSIRHKYAGQYYYPKSYTICPDCNNTDFGIRKSTLLSKTCNVLNLIIGKREHYWMLVLLEKRSKAE